MPRGRWGRAGAAAQTWQDLQAHCLWPEQELYELIRPVLLDHQSIKDRAKETGFSSKTVARRLEQFVQHGLFDWVQRPGGVAHRPDDRRILPAPIREHILLLKADHAPLTPHEIATICEIKFDRPVSHSTIKRVLNRYPVPHVVSRRFPRYHEISNGVERREVVIRLHLEGWTTSRISEYLSVSRQTVTTFLRQRWQEEGVAGLADKPHSRTPGSRKATLRAVQAIKDLQGETLIGAHRMAAALKQRYGIVLSPRTCGRIMALNRELFELPEPHTFPKLRKPMPFAATRPHEIWSVDLRYIEHHQVPEYADQPLYVFTILDNYSRSIVASAPAPTQDTSAFLLVLFLAIHVHGAPERLVSDGGGVFRSNQAMEIYERLGIQKDQIEHRRPYQNYVETHFKIMRKMLDVQLAHATSWEAFCARHAQFVADYNWQPHFAHKVRVDQLRAPREVLRWFHGRYVELPTLDEIFQSRHAHRHLNRRGYIRYHHWRLYGDEGLANEETEVWLYKETLTLAVRDEPVTQYQVTYETDRMDRRELYEVTELRAFPPHPARKQVPQAPLWTEQVMSDIEWYKVKKLHPYAPRKKLESSGWVQTSLFA